MTAFQLRPGLVQTLRPRMDVIEKLESIVEKYSTKVARHHETYLMTR